MPFASLALSMLLCSCLSCCSADNDIDMEASKPDIDRDAVTNAAVLPEGQATAEATSKTPSQPLSDFLLQLEEYSPTVSLPFLSCLCCDVISQHVQQFQTSASLKFCCLQFEIVFSSKPSTQAYHSLDSGCCDNTLPELVRLWDFRPENVSCFRAMSKHLFWTNG